MNDLITTWGLEGLKPMVSALLLPPVPLLLLVLVGARLMFRHRLLAWVLVLAGVGGIWITATPALGKLMRQGLYPVPQALDASRIAELRRQGEDTAIVVLGGGSRPLSPEYGMSNLSPIGMERLRYALWLSRETRLPVAYSGGLGHGARPGATEAEIAARIAEREFGRPLRWLEDRSRDTAENALLTTPILQAAGIRRIVLVTHDFHQPRAARAFSRAAQRIGLALEIVPAPMGMVPGYEWRWQDFVPGRTGFADSQLILHEWLGYWLGA